MEETLSVTDNLKIEIKPPQATESERIKIQNTLSEHFNIDTPDFRIEFCDNIGDFTIAYLKVYCAGMWVYRIIREFTRDEQRAKETMKSERAREIYKEFTDDLLTRQQFKEVFKHLDAWIAEVERQEGDDSQRFDGVESNLPTYQVDMNDPATSLRRNIQSIAVDNQDAVKSFLDNIDKNDKLEAYHEQYLEKRSLYQKFPDLINTSYKLFQCIRDGHREWVSRRKQTGSFPSITTGIDPEDELNKWLNCFFNENSDISFATMAEVTKYFNSRDTEKQFITNLPTQAISKQELYNLGYSTALVSPFGVVLLRNPDVMRYEAQPILTPKGENPTGEYRVLLHADMQPSYSLGDFHTYHLNNVRVPEFLAMTPPWELKAEHFYSIENAEVRKEFIEKIGLDVLINRLDHIVHDTDDEHGYKLLSLNLTARNEQEARGEVDNDESSARHEYVKYLLMENPSTGQHHVEGVGNECETIIDALNWRKPDHIRNIPVDDENGEDWYQQGDVLFVRAGTKSIKQFPKILT